MKTKIKVTDLQKEFKNWFPGDHPLNMSDIDCLFSNFGELKKVVYLSDLVQEISDIQYSKGLKDGRRQIRDKFKEALG